LLELEKLLPLKNIFYFLCAHLMGGAAGLIEAFLPAECMARVIPVVPPKTLPLVLSISCGCVNHFYP